MKLDKNLLQDSFSANYNSCFNARGQYDSMQFVVRLRPDLHKKLKDTNSVGIVKAGSFDSETIQAFSTYLHETIHWWQHIGSISGLILSFSFPMQSHINHENLKKYTKYTGKIKPITRYNELNAKAFEPSDEEFQNINRILNNFYDIEFYKSLVIDPKLAKNFINDPFFESMGHSFHLTYGLFIQLLSSTFDPKLSFLPQANKWENEFRRLRDNEVMGYYYKSDIHLSPIGLKEIYEGQARFIQIQYLYFSSGSILTWADFEKEDMLSGVYYEAFSLFLKLTESKRPDSIDSPLVALFLLISDLAINPTDGFPFDIFHYESFIESVDPGIRFCYICHMISTKLQELKDYIKEYSTEEYLYVSKKISDAICSPSPIAAAKLIQQWVKEQQSLIDLMEEEKIFEFREENFPIRLIFSQFIKYQLDKLKNPAFFCWTGAYIAGKKCSIKGRDFFQEHEALFCDDIDGDIYPRKIFNKEESAVQKTFDTFYSWIAIYDLCNQWIKDEGQFKYDYFWLTSKYLRNELEEWAKKHFLNAYGINIDEFRILD